MLESKQALRGIVAVDVIGVTPVCYSSFGVPCLHTDADDYFVFCWKDHFLGFESARSEQREDGFYRRNKPTGSIPIKPALNEPE